MFSNTIALIAAVMMSSSAVAKPFTMHVPEGQEGFTEQFKAAPAVRVGDFVYISGVVAGLPPNVEATPENYERAIRNAFERTGTVLASAGASWDDVVEMTSFHVNMRDHQDVFAKVREEYVGERPYSAWTGIGVEKLWADMLFGEIRVVAYVGE